jgi:hypothetical protein
MPTDLPHLPPPKVRDPIAQAVDNGIAWLQQEGPNYGFDINRIELAKLDITDGFDCPLGQAGQGYYSDLLNNLAEWLEWEGSSAQRWNWAEEHGFYVRCEYEGGPKPDAMYARYDAINNEWVRRLTELRSNR